jgi:hypothetical protein
MDPRMTSDERWDFVNAILERRRDNPQDDDPEYLPIEVAVQRIVDKWESELPITGMPERNDPVATWLKEHRDAYSRADERWTALDWMLDDYRLHADVGQPLHVEVTEGGHDEEEGQMWSHTGSANP